MTARRCPICDKPMVALYRPFCSSRCADVDLNRWLTGSYSIENGDSELESDGPPRADKEE
jgi:hypothetical protein